MPTALSLPRISTNVRFAASALLAPDLAGAWAERLFLTPPRPKDAVLSSLDLVDAKSGLLEHKGRAIATWTLGRAQPRGARGAARPRLGRQRGADARLRLPAALGRLSRRRLRPASARRVRRQADRSARFRRRARTGGVAGRRRARRDRTFTWRGGCGARHRARPAGAPRRGHRHLARRRRAIRGASRAGTGCPSACARRCRPRSRSASACAGRSSTPRSSPRASPRRHW